MMRPCGERANELAADNHTCHVGEKFCSKGGFLLCIVSASSWRHCFICIVRALDFFLFSLVVHAWLNADPVELWMHMHIALL